LKAFIILDGPLTPAQVWLWPGFRPASVHQKLGLHVVPPQDAQKGSPARPQQVKGRGGTNRTSCGPFALIIDLGERKNPLQSFRYLRNPPQC